MVSINTSLTIRQSHLIIFLKMPHCYSIKDEAYVYGQLVLIETKKYPRRSRKKVGRPRKEDPDYISPLKNGKKSPPQRSSIRQALKKSIIVAFSDSETSVPEQSLLRKRKKASGLSIKKIKKIKVLESNITVDSSDSESNTEDESKTTVDSESDGLFVEYNHIIDLCDQINQPNRLTTCKKRLTKQIKHNIMLIMYKLNAKTNGYSAHELLHNLTRQETYELLALTDKLQSYKKEYYLHKFTKEAIIIIKKIMKLNDLMKYQDWNWNRISDLRTELVEMNVEAFGQSRLLNQMDNIFSNTMLNWIT